jgi:hypothetical protein
VDESIGALADVETLNMTWNLLNDRKEILFELNHHQWDAQMMFFLNHGCRVIVHDRRGHGRSTQTGDGHDNGPYADTINADLLTFLKA